MDRPLAPFRLLAWLLAAVLVVSLAALPAQARDLVETDTSIDLADDEPAIGDTITITALVERLDDETGDVTGQVKFVAGTAESGPFGTTLGQAALSGGEANLAYTVATATLPAGTTDSFYVVAEYLGNGTFEASTSDPVLIEITPTDPIPTTIEVTGPAQADAHSETELTAAVLPAEATGTVTFTVDGSDVGTAPVLVGTATLAYTFMDGNGNPVVTATFEPEDPEQYLPSVSPVYGVDLSGSPGPGTAPYTWKPTIGLGLGCRPTAGPPATNVPERRLPLPFTTFINFGFPTFSPLFTFSPFLSFFNGFSFNFEACVLGSIFIGPYSTRAETTVPVDCAPTETGYQCRFDLPGPPASMTIDPALPVPAEFAGQSIPVTTTVTQVDPETGEVSTVFDDTRTVDVPKRTTLSAKLAPAKSGVTSVKRGAAVAYRLDVQNMGIVTADQVRACVSISKGASIKAAKGATVKGRQACWTLPSLKSTKSAARTLTVIAPKKAGELKLAGAVTPKKSQADPVRLTTALPVS